MKTDPQETLYAEQGKMLKVKFEAPIVEKTRQMIREITDPVELQRQLREMLEDAYPVRPVFEEDETIPFHEFERRFKGTVCGGNETRFSQWQVTIVIGIDGEFLLDLGTAAEGKVARVRSPRP